MARIDKIYGTLDQYLQLKSWIEKNKPEFLVNIYPIYQFKNAGKKDIFPLSNFSHWQDEWLLENCPLKFVVKRLKEQYGIKDE